MWKALRHLSIMALVFWIGWISKPTETVTNTVTVHTPPTVFFPVANQGVEIQPRMRWINMDAEVPIFMLQDEAAIQQLIEFSGNGFLEGAYVHEPNEAVYLLGTWTMECETIIHEYTHMLEANMPDQAWRIRRVFHKLCSDKFRIDEADLIEVLTEPKVFGPPTP